MMQGDTLDSPLPRPSAVKGDEIVVLRGQTEAEGIGSVQDNLWFSAIDVHRSSGDYVRVIVHRIVEVAGKIGHLVLEMYDQRFSASKGGHARGLRLLGQDLVSVKE